MDIRCPLLGVHLPALKPVVMHVALLGEESAIDRCCRSSVQTGNAVHFRFWGDDYLKLFVQTRNVLVAADFSQLST